MHDDFDSLLARHLRQRPEFSPLPDLAAAAMTRAQPHIARRRALHRLARQVRLCTTIAGILFVSILAYSLLQWPALVDTSQSTVTAVETADSGALATWGLLLIGLAGLVFWRAMSFRDDRMAHPL